MAWSPLAGGKLMTEDTDLKRTLISLGKEYKCDPANVALAWILAHPSKILPVVGSNNLERISKLPEATKIEIDRKAWFQLYTAAVGAEVP